MTSVPVAIVRLMLRKPLGRAMRLGPEDAEAIRLANLLRAWTLDGSLRAVWWHTASEVGGGGKNAALRYALAKAMGLIPGSPDYVFCAASGSFLLELKAPDGRPSETQKDFQSWAIHAGVPYAVAYGCDDAVGILKSWNLIP